MRLASYEIIGNDAEWRVRLMERPKTSTRLRRPPSKWRKLPLRLHYGRGTRSGLQPRRGD
jgi:hypothetical protein